MPSPRPLPDAIGPYQVLRELGAGAMGRVYLARSPGGRQVAVKLLRPELARSDGYRARFAAEVQAAKEVAGLFTAPVIEADPYAPEPWLATAYVAGPTLEQAIAATGPLEEQRLRELAAGLAEALLAIHAVGVVHRDLKPGNVLMSTDGPRVIDFGISSGDGAPDGSPDGAPDGGWTALGSLGYAAPEQVAGQGKADRRADVFSLGAVLAFAATGRGPFGEGAPAALLYRVVHEEPDLRGVPAGVLDTLVACLAKDPAARPTVPDVIAALAPPDWLPAQPAPAATTAATAVGPQDTDPPTSYRYPMTRPLAAPNLPTVPAPPPAGDAVAARRGLTRRNMLIAAGAAGAAVFATGAGLLAAELSGGSAPTDAAASAAASTAQPATASSPAETPSVVTGTISVNAASLPQAPKPLWSAAAPAAVPTGQIATLDDVVFWFPLSTGSGQDLLVYDTADGRLRWTGTQKAPVSDTAQTVWWGGLFGSLLYGFSTNYTSSTDYPINTIFGLDAQGDQVVSRQVDTNYLIARLNCVVDDVAVANLDEVGTGAISLSSGAMLWSVASSATVAATADADRCYMYDSGLLTAFDLRVGNVLWSAQTQTFDHHALWLAGDTVIATGASDTGVATATETLVLDCATGKQLWSTADSTPFGVLGSTVYTSSVETAYLTAVEARTGAKMWQFDSPALGLDLPTSTSYPIPGTMASTKLVAYTVDDISDVISSAGATPVGSSAPGFLVLGQSTGRALWAYAGPSTPLLSDDSVPLVVTVSDTAVYASDGNKLYAFEAGA